MAPPDERDPTPGSILRELVFNQYQAIVLGGAAVASLVTVYPLPLLLWLGSELVLLPVLDSGPLRRLVGWRWLGNRPRRRGLARGLSRLRRSRPDDGTPGR